MVACDFLVFEESLGAAVALQDRQCADHVDDVEGLVFSGNRVVLNKVNTEEGVA